MPAEDRHDPGAMSGWVWPTNVRTALEYVSRWVAHPYDDIDWQAVENALPTTSWEPPERWFDYPLGPLTVHLARTPDADPVGIRIEGPVDEILAARIDTLLTLLSDPRA